MALLWRAACSWWRQLGVAGSENEETALQLLASVGTNCAVPTVSPAPVGPGWALPLPAPISSCPVSPENSLHVTSHPAVPLAQSQFYLYQYGDQGHVLMDASAAPTLLQVSLFVLSCMEGLCFVHTFCKGLEGNQISHKVN